MNFFLRFIGIFVAVAVAIWIVPGINVISTDNSWAEIAIVALIIALLNISVKPILQLIGLPISVLTLGVFYLVINTFLLYIAAGIGNALFNVGLHIDSFASGFIASIIISIVSSILNGLLGASD